MTASELIALADELTLSPKQMLLDAARFIEREKPEWAKAARKAAATLPLDVAVREALGWLIDAVVQEVVFTEITPLLKRRVEDACAALGREDKIGAARHCTCHPSDNPPVPCAQKFAYSECVTSEPKSQEPDAVAVIDDIAKWLHDETAHPESYLYHTWPETDRDDGQREGGFVKIVPLHAQEYFRDIARRLVARYPFAGGR